MKRRLWIILSLALLTAALCCFPALADQSGSCGDDLTWTYTSSTGRFTISGRGGT